MAGMLLGILMAAMDNTIVATAMGTIVADLGGSATNSGLILAPMMIGSVVFLFSGVFLLGWLTPDSPRWLVMFDMILTGFGTGFSFSVLSMSAIHTIGVRQRGSATSTNWFLVSMGTTLGITVFGIIQSSLFHNQTAGVAFGQDGDLEKTISIMLTPSGRATVPESVRQIIVDALSSSIAQTFAWALIPAAAAVFAVFLMSNERMVVHAKAKAGPQSSEGVNRQEKL